jgi:hypothetical protein
MASGTYNAGSLALQNGGVVWASDTIEVIAVKSSYTFDPDHTAGTPAASEITGVSGYTGGYNGAGRKVLAGKSLTNDTTNNRTVYDATDPGSYGALGAGDTIGGYVVQKKGSADDTTAVPLFFLEVTDTPTNGSPVSLAFHADGIGYTQQS